MKITYVHIWIFINLRFNWQDFYFFPFPIFIPFSLYFPLSSLHFLPHQLLGKKNPFLFSPLFPSPRFFYLFPFPFFLSYSISLINFLPNRFLLLFLQIFILFPLLPFPFLSHPVFPFSPLIFFAIIPSLPISLPLPSFPTWFPSQKALYCFPQGVMGGGCK